MNLVIDIGNSRVKAGVFTNNKLVKAIAFESFSIKALQTFIKKLPVKNAIVSTVTEYPEGLMAFLKQNFTSVELTVKTSLPFINGYSTPKTLGKDRLAAVAGAQHKLPNKNVLVVNAGTCITYDFIDNKGVYHGGSISPGLEMRFSALHTFTGRLPLIEPDTSFKNLVGKTTKESIVTGVQQGMMSEMEGIIQAYKNRFNNLQVIVTGGWHKWLENGLKGKIISEPYLTLTGLNVILALGLTQHNTRKK